VDKQYLLEAERIMQESGVVQAAAGAA